eukprot:TRINITY_DN562_c0_g1_i6.p1 TRINITY_DN562_c0_g1~~TRINITY_DN562_c0_g1_i6.p1  ORF type:complete len:853 (-),score=233.70 TRINITY_DN562_c0_g1_i6:186-2744(-)
MSMFRSQQMRFYSLYLPRDSAWTLMNKLGETSAMQLVDMNPGETHLNRPFAGMIKRIEDLEGKLKYVEQEMQKFKVKTRRGDNIDAFMRGLRAFLSLRGKTQQTFFDEIEAETEEKLKVLGQHVKMYESGVAKRNEWVEYKSVLERTKDYVLGLVGHGDVHASGEDVGVDFYAASGIRVSFIAGTIATEDTLRFKRMVFRVSRGNTWTIVTDIPPHKPEAGDAAHEEDNFLDIVDPQTGTAVRRSVFLVVYQGGAYDTMKSKLTKICDSFGAQRFNLPDSQKDYDAKMREIGKELGSTLEVLRGTRRQIDQILQTYSTPRFPDTGMSYLDELRLFLTKEKTLYHNLNLLRAWATYYEGYCWAPIEEEQNILRALTEAVRENPTIAGGKFVEEKKPHGAAPPTYFKDTDFMYPFQQVVDTYGIPRYREVNPALFAVITFPFLFGVMFGDVGHGGLFLVFASIFVWKADELKSNKALAGLLRVRYLFLLMGVFATYCGLIYNDFLSIPLNLFGSCYVRNEQQHTFDRKPGCTYPIGLDPKWHVSGNELEFINSLKMKLAIVLGVSQMILGIFLKAVNAIHFGSTLDFVFEFIPQLLFMCCTFGYMAITFFIKWSTDWAAGPGTQDAPSIIALFIDMFFNGGKVTKPLWGDGRDQESLQKSMLVIAVICVPMMLIPKPLILFLQHAMAPPARHDEHRPLLEEEMRGPGEQSRGPPPLPGAGGHGHGEEFDMGEIVVHSLIETIEFVLGSISHTASYLRLWALSLAHAELSKILFEKTIGESLVEGSVIGVFIGFTLFANLTMAILMSLDVMECFLHTLRLHWIEFQSKFYKGDGYKFAPFSFSAAIANIVDRETG